MLADETRAFLTALAGGELADEHLWLEALTHGSTGHERDYQRLEFLGDRVLGLVSGVVEGHAADTTPEQIRRRANALVSRATQACLIARRGSGFLLTDPAQRWARQALFFHVWSCPRPVATATIRDLAGMTEPPACGFS